MWALGTMFFDPTFVTDAELAHDLVRPRLATAKRVAAVSDGCHPKDAAR